MITMLRRLTSGLLAQQLNLDVTANNIANVNTPGFKRGRPEFEPAIPELEDPPPLSGLALPVQVPGLGPTVRPPTASRVFAQGPVQETASPLDVAIEGDGFFQVLRADGSVAYTRNGALSVGADGRLTVEGGFPLAPEVRIPPDAAELHIAWDGAVSAVMADGTWQQVGAIELARFPVPEGLQSIGDGLLLPTEASGPPQVGQPGTGRLGTLQPGKLEGSNVDLAREMTSMVIAQRTYALTLKALQSADEMLAEASRLRGGAA